MKFYFSEVDAELSLKELLFATLCGFGVIGVPLLIKCVLGMFI